MNVKFRNLMLCKETPAICSEIHRKHINTVYEQKVEVLHVQPDSPYCYH